MKNFPLHPIINYQNINAKLVLNIYRKGKGYEENT